ncbi:uncharacterized protein LOC119582830 [Penaeus monodon]|uniref:uncharacterized protein LOC119582830 n=1 Tax=Penaeus monodon TaxID=6687 RepID=UPI0018A764D9|nr:uncharacterized protein LOC119582830 [Penaeus monodon]
MMGVRQYAGAVGVLLLAMGAAAWVSSVAYRKAGSGGCGDAFASCYARSLVSAAMICTASSQCRGFSYESLRCEMHSRFTPPDNASSIPCYFPVSEISGAVGDTAMTTTSAPYPYAAVQPSLSNTHIRQVGEFSRCNNNGAVVGLYKELLGDYYFICKTSPNDIPLNTGSTGSSCSSSPAGCLNTECSPGRVFHGYDWNQRTGPCYDITSGQATVDRNDCYVVSFVQDLPVGASSSWAMWRICVGDEFFVVTKVEIVSMLIYSITCCRAHAT